MGKRESKIQNSLRFLQFQLREKLWGRLRFRASLPQPKESAGEIELYRKFIMAALEESVRSRFTDVVDVGCRNWSYIKALRQSFPQAKLWGIELDGNRRYFNLHRRIDFARAFAASSGGEVVHGDFLKSPELTQLKIGEAPLFTFFFPFVSPRPCLKWGLPLEYVNFARCLAQAKSLTEAPVAILSVHQGEWEAELAREAYFKLLSKKPPQEIVLSAKILGSAWPASFDAHIFYLD